MWAAMRGNKVATEHEHWDPRLRGRTYSIPFEQVWQASLALANRGLRRWQLIDSNDTEGVINAEAKTFFLRFVDDVRILISLDEDAQTRVDVFSRSRRGSADFGTNARRINRFFKALDRKLAPPRKK
jgi:uncharacterized protein (DUF1499 family)